MADLSTWFMGLKLSNPLVVGASGLTGTPEGIEKAAASGVGAIVMKSLFEEQILAELGKETQGLDLDAYPDAEAFISRTAWEQGTEKYLDLVVQAKARAGAVPVFASINCIGPGNWASFASQIESAGADGLELNIAYMPFSTSLSSRDIEDRVLSTVREVRRATRLPIEVKLGQNYSSLPNLAKAISKEGANALVLFNRFFHFDIDLKRMKLIGAQPLSSPDEYHESLRWVSLLYQRAGIELAGATGIHDARTVLKFIVAGAGTVQICSVLHRKGWVAVPQLLKDLSEILDGHEIVALESLRGKLSAQVSGHPEDYQRLQYIKALTGIY
ncbi:MAG: dihydroorotate dehydrogenase-like protein [Spirochaetaceae bacterium]|nr:dihydroorotate dehydrogenase-like protein [Spirochaetaceae bacterium]